jgi:hypothetical protein
MGWFRRSRTEAPPASTPDASTPTDDRLLPVAVATAPALARTERALQMLAAQSAQLHATVVHLEHRVDAMASALLDQMERPSYDDLLAARTHSAKVAGELARLEVNLAARLEAVQSDLRALRGEDREIDPRRLTPVDTGWERRAG